jgi:cell division protease FtsH
LLKYETIGAEQIDQIMQGKVPNPPEGWDEPGSDENSRKRADAASDSADDPGDTPSIGDTAEQH